MTEPAPRRRHSGTFDPTGAITAQGDAANDLARFGGSVTDVGEGTASRSVVVLGGAVALVVVTLLLGAVAISIRAEFDAAQERSRFDTGVVESNVTKTLEAVETSLLTVARQFGEGDAVRSVSARVDALEAAYEALAFSPTMR
jgi:hypothetical protein